MTPDELKALVRTVPDFPRPGIQFRDITTLIGNGAGFAAAVDQMAERTRAIGADAVAAVEARGFIFGAAVAAMLGIAFIPVRKPGKLPVPVLAIDYALEYGVDTLEIDPDAISSGLKIVIIDDLIATGGTMLAAAELLRKAGGDVDSALCAIALPDLGGVARMEVAGIEVDALMEFPGH